MPARKSKSTVAKAAKKPASGAAKSTKAKAHTAAGKIKNARIEQTGLTSRVRGHVSAQGRRNQAGRNTR